MTVAGAVGVAVGVGVGAVGVAVGVGAGEADGAGAVGACFLTSKVSATRQAQVVCEVT